MAGLTPSQALQILHELVELMALSGKERDTAREATRVLAGAIKPVDMGGGIPEQGKA